MPYVEVRTNVSATDEARDTLLGALVTTTASHLEKPEDVTMAHLGAPESFRFKGSSAPTAFVSIRAIGLPDVEARKALVANVSALLESSLGVPSDRAFIVFDDVPRDRWGVRGTILG